MFQRRSLPKSARALRIHPPCTSERPAASFQQADPNNPAPAGRPDSGTSPGAFQSPCRAKQPPVEQSAPTGAPALPRRADAPDAKAGSLRGACRRPLGCPFAWVAQHVESVRLGRALGRNCLVLEGDERWRADEDTLDALRAEPKLHPPVVQQVELNVPASPKQLPLLLLVGVLARQPLAHDGHVRTVLGEGATHQLLRKTLRPLLGHVVKEDAADAAVLLPCGQEKVVITGGLHALVDAWPAVARAECSEVRVERHAVLVLHIARRQVDSSSEPLPLSDHEEANISPQRGHERRGGVEDKGECTGGVDFSLIDIHVHTR
mmetsp:Transcript_16180/g.49142  ORF Transcript_16180/g.49142 Transcript_16180/m.49142 type:complete len:320 (-) Transcript_16180:268-1227(-)